MADEGDFDPVLAKANVCVSNKNSKNKNKFS
jgi:hypothetical protein